MVVGVDDKEEGSMIGYRIQYIQLCSYLIAVFSVYQIQYYDPSMLSENYDSSLHLH